MEENKLFSEAITAASLNALTKSFTVKEVQVIIKNQNRKKVTSGYDLIINQVLQMLPDIGIKFIIITL
jgi:archaeosine-15-forming tRNA-guanine transglycosylase